MFSFDGQFKSRPVVALGGSSKKEQRTSLIKRTQAERQKRETFRRQNASAITIQSFIRAEKVRHKLYDKERAEFDEEVKSLGRVKDHQTDPAIFPILLRRLLFFYSETKDAERLMWMMQYLLKHRIVSPQNYAHYHDVWIYQIKQLLLLCCRSLSTSLSRGSSPVALQLRMLEVFSSDEAFKGPDPQQSRRDAAVVTLFLIRNGYFNYLRSLINLKVPASLELSARPPTPLAGAVADLVIRPVHQICLPQTNQEDKVSDQSVCHEVMSYLARDLLCPEASEQVKCFLLPYLAAPDTKLPYSAFLDAIHSSLSRSSSGMTQYSSSKPVSVSPTPWLLYAVLQLAESHMGSLSAGGLLRYIQVLQLLLPQLPSAVTETDGEIDDSDDEMEVDLLQDSRLSELREKCLSVLNSRRHVKGLETLVTSTIGRTTERTCSFGEAVITSLCNVCYYLMTECRLPVATTRCLTVLVCGQTGTLSRWYLHVSIVSRRVTLKNPHRLLYTFALNRVFVRELWRIVTMVTTRTSNDKEVPLLQVISRGTNLSVEEAEKAVPSLSLFCFLFSKALFSVHDQEFYGESSSSGRGSIMPFSLQELVPMSSTLRDVVIGVIDMIYPDSFTKFDSSYLHAMRSVGARSGDLNKSDMYPHKKWIQVLKDITQLVKQLHSRDIRRQFCPEDHWLSRRVNIDPDQMRIDGFFNEEDVVEGVIQPGTSFMTERHMCILRHIPFVVPFRDRVVLFQRIIGSDRNSVQGDLHRFMMGPSIEVTAHRKYIYQDAFDHLTEDKAPNLKQAVRVRLINNQGLDEAGVDGGGLFREFLNEVLKAGFHPNVGFFLQSQESQLYPNPQAQMIVPNYLNHYHFLGRMLGKALYENMLVELPLSSFFLCKLLSRHGADVDIHHLESLDPEMYRNLLILKDFDGNVEELSLNFTVVNNELGEKQEVELKPGGHGIPVTNSNRIEYIHLMADYRLNKQIRAHCQAFRTGLSNVINLNWLRMFDQNELQVLISGAPVPVDLEDLRQHTNYSGGFTDEHPVIQSFWRAASEFTDQQKRCLLKFVTSCSRPPLLGFSELYPAFCIHNGGDEDRLPSASTCMNLLKLPPFKDDKTMRDRVLYAIESGAGFELS